MSDPVNGKPARPVTPLGILVEQLELTLEIARSTSASPELTETLQTAYALAAGLDPYLDQCTTRESSALSALIQKTQAEPWEKRFSDVVKRYVS